MSETEDRARIAALEAVMRETIRACWRVASYLEGLCLAEPDLHHPSTLADCRRAFAALQQLDEARRLLGLEVDSDK